MQFLRGEFSGKNSPIRPPWSVDEQLFASVCDTCGECITQCPTHIIKKGRGNFPVIDFEAGECLFCGDCADSCHTHAILKQIDITPWQVTASIKENCLAYNNVECRSCYDPCEVRAISIKPRIGGVSIPIIDETLCTGCGACHSVCPTQSISLQQITEST